MLLIAVDEDFNNDILRGMLRRKPNLDIVRVQDVGLSGSDDPASNPMPGVFEVPRSLSIGAAVEDLLLLAECSLEGEWEGQVRYLPLR